MLDGVKSKLLLNSGGHVTASTPLFEEQCFVLFCFDLTLNSGGWADDKCLLEGFRLATQPSGTRWNGDTLLSEPRNVDGGLLVQRRLVVKQRNRSPRRRHLLEKQKQVSAGNVLIQVKRSETAKKNLSSGDEETLKCHRVIS